MSTLSKVGVIMDQWGGWVVGMGRDGVVSGTVFIIIIEGILLLSLSLSLHTHTHTYTHTHTHIYIYMYISGFGGLGVACWPLRVQTRPKPSDF